MGAMRNGESSPSSRKFLVALLMANLSASSSFSCLSSSSRFSLARNNGARATIRLRPKRWPVKTHFHKAISRKSAKRSDDNENDGNYEDGKDQTNEEQKTMMQRRIDEILAVAHSQHAMDVSTSLSNTLLPESTTRFNSKDNVPIPFEWRSKTSSILETTQPVLDPNECRLIQQAAMQYWERTGNSSSSAATTGSSRFTFQGRNKREAHAHQLDPNSQAIQVINDALESTIYPLLRKVFCDESQEQQQPIDSFLVYDSLVIEYDARSCANAEEFPAQPLHRDLGLFSVNIALNDPCEFKGGGTVFERLLTIPNQQQLKGNHDDDKNVASIVPRSVGHMVAHPCRERHAGGALKSGRRAILVIFLTGRTNDVTEGPGGCPKLELATRCKAIGMALADQDKKIPIPSSGAVNEAAPLNGEYDRILCYRAAIQSDPLDGEAYLLLAMALLSSSSIEKSERYPEILRSLQKARELNPSDGRIYNTLGIALKGDMEIRASEKPDDEDNYRLIQEQEGKIVEAFRTASQLHSLAAQAGCQGAEKEARAALLNYGLWHANRDEMESAIGIFRQICVSGPLADNDSDLDEDEKNPEREDPKDFQAKRVVKDATALLAFCERQLEKQRMAYVDPGVLREEAKDC